MFQLQGQQDPDCAHVMYPLPQSSVILTEKYAEFVNVSFCKYKATDFSSQIKLIFM